MRRLPARPVYFGLSFVLRMPTWVVMAVYLVQELHFSPLQLVLMGTVMEAAVFVSEVPTGILADAYSRRASIISMRPDDTIAPEATRRSIDAVLYIVLSTVCRLM